MLGEVVHYLPACPGLHAQCLLKKNVYCSCFPIMFYFTGFLQIKEISHQLSEMEAAKREYARKNSEQSKTISNFVSQVSGLQADLQALSNVQESMSEATK